jgi:hypothetical protein
MKLPPKRFRVLRGLTPLLWLAFFGLGQVGCGNDVDLAAAPQAVAGCEAPTADELNPEATMLPGRDCMVCHRQKGFPTAAQTAPDGQASRRAWTAAGTVYDSPTSKCNGKGLEGVKVEIADSNKLVLITLYTNRAGNFFTSEPLNFSSIIARISKDGKVKQMQGVMGSADCPSCHTPTGIAGGRIYLN